MKIYTLIFSLFSAVIVLAMDNNNKNVLTIPIKEHIKLLPEYAKGEIKQYKYSSAKYKMDSLGKIALEDTVHAIIEITNEIKVKDGYLLKWKFIEYFRDTALMSIAEKPSQAALDATIRQTVFKVKYDKDASFEELINEDEIVEIMNNNNEKEKELKSKLS